MPVRGIRGATTVRGNTREDILEATKEMLETLIDVNAVNPEDVASAWFTTTADVNTEFPAVAARQLGWTFVPLMCSHEMMVPGSLPLCVRVLIHINTEKSIHEMRHVYLRGASALRPDLASSTHSTAR